MKSLLGPVLFAFLLASHLSAAPPAPAAPPADSWALDPDRETGKSVFLRKGQARAEVIALLGKRFSRQKSKKTPELEILRFSRTIVGPFVVKQVRTTTGIMNVRHNIFYVDRIEITLRDGIVETVLVKRDLERDGGIPRLSRSAPPDRGPPNLLRSR